MKRITLIALALFVPAVTLASVCFTPSSLSDTTPETIGSSSEPTLQSILTGAGYSITVTSDQTQYQRWDGETLNAASITADHIADYSANEFVFGYYTGGSMSNFVPMFKTASISGYELVPLASVGAVTVDDVTGSSIGFAIRHYWGSSYAGTSATQNTLSDSGDDLAIVFNVATDRYALAFEDWAGGDYDYNDIIVDVSLECPSCSILISPSVMNEGSEATLSWSSTSTPDGWFTISEIGEVNEDGSTTVSPSASTTYLGYLGPDGDVLSCQATISIEPVCAWDEDVLTDGESVTAYESPTLTDGSSCSTITETRTCSDGTLSGSYEYPSCSCTPTYSCDGSTILYNDSTCVAEPVTTCSPPFFCSPGSSTCLETSVDFNGDGDLTGHLQVFPAFVRPGAPAFVFWDVSNVASCTITEDNPLIEDSWSSASSTFSSGEGGQETSPITQPTTYMLQCTGTDALLITEEAEVYLVPEFQES